MMLIAGCAVAPRRVKRHASELAADANAPVEIFAIIVRGVRPQGNMQPDMPLEGPFARWADNGVDLAVGAPGSVCEIMR